MYKQYKRSLHHIPPWKDSDRVIFWYLCALSNNPSPCHLPFVSQISSCLLFFLFYSAHLRVFGLPQDCGPLWISSLLKFSRVVGQWSNTVDKQHILDILESASDYKKGVEQLDNKGKAIMQKLRELGGDIAKVARNKLKHTVLTCLHLRCDANSIGIGSKFETETKGLKTKWASAKPVPVKPIKKENATLAQWIEILNWFHKNGKNQSKTAKHFNTVYPNLNIRQPLVSFWVNDEPMWREHWEQSNH